MKGLLTRLAYYISGYKRPESIIRLINVLSRGQSARFYVHFDKKIGCQKYSNWKAIVEQNCPAETYVFSEFDSKWGTMGMVSATLSAMSYFEDANYDYFINLTEECYPLKAPSQIMETFEDQNSGFMTYWKLPYKGWYQGGMNRINSHFFFLPKKKYPYVRSFRIPRLRKKLPFNLEPYGGSSLFCLPKDFVSYLVKFLENKPSVFSFFKRTFIPSEMIFQTVLMNSPLRDRIVNDNKRYMDFEESHPRVLTNHDYPKLKNSEKLFARKFSSAIDKDILDIIDNDILEPK